MVRQDCLGFLFVRLTWVAIQSVTRAGSLNHETVPNRTVFLCDRWALEKWQVGEMRMP